MLRAGITLAIAVCLAWIAFGAIVERETDKIISVHALESAGHLAELFPTDDASLAAFSSGKFPVESGFEQFLLLSRSLHLQNLYFVNRVGEVTFRTDLAGMALNRTATADAALSPGAGAMAVATGSVPGSEAGTKIEVPSHSGGAVSGLPDGADLLGLLDGKMPGYSSVETIQSDTSQDLIMARIVLPVRATSGEISGLVGMTLGVGHMEDSFASGVSTFGFLFVVFGVVLFGIPAVAFQAQRKLAETSSRNADYLSRHDALTGVFNRSFFLEEAGQLLRDGEIGCVAHVDIDRFMVVNDTYGHEVGDELLRRIAGLLSQRCGDDALVARLGGDEFAIALRGERTARTKALLDRLMRDASADMLVEGRPVSTSLSIGLADPAPQESLDSVLKRADVALGVAKSSGRSRAVHYTAAMGTAANKRRSLEALVRKACRDREFSLAYQPLVDAGSSETLGFEALLRLKDAEGVPVSPGDFVPLAEEIGLIEEIGTWVLQTATRDIAQLDNHSHVSVNLSVEQFRSGRLVGIVKHALRMSGLPPERLELEITESILMDEETRTKLQIDALQDLGISIAMDDFGTGFSSLSTLWKFGFDRIKIDRSFVQAMDETPDKSRKLIATVILLGERLGMSVTAEGIETDAQRAVLVELGCNVLQGFFFGRPEPLEAHRDRGISHAAS